MNKRAFLRHLGLGVLGTAAVPLLRSGVLGSDDETPSRGKNWMWLRRGRGQTTDDWKHLFATARASGIDAVLPEVYNGHEALYESTRHPMGGTWLEELLPIARDEGLELHAWMWQMPCNQEDVWAEHPEWYAVNRLGQPSWKSPAYVEYYRFMCPSRPAVQEFLRANAAEVAAIDGVSGVHLDYIRYPDVILAKQFQKKYGIVQDKEYPAYDYCYCELCREEFGKQYGTDPLSLADPASSAEWRQFRYDRINNVVNEVLLPEIHGHGKHVSAAVFPNWESVRQQWTTWKIDAVLPMLYHGFYDEEIGWIGENAAWGVRSVGGRMKLYAGLFAGHLDPRTLPEAIASARKGGAAGISIFEGRDLDGQMWKALQETLRP